MNKPKDTRDTKRASDLKSTDLLPREEVLRKTDDLLRTMLNSPPKPFIRKARAKPKKRAK